MTKDKKWDDTLDEVYPIDPELAKLGKAAARMSEDAENESAKYTPPSFEKRIEQANQSGIEEETSPNTWIAGTQSEAWKKDVARRIQEKMASGGISPDQLNDLLKEMEKIRSIDPTSTTPNEYAKAVEKVIDKLNEVLKPN